VRSTFEAELGDVIPVVKTSIGGSRIIGRLCAGKGFFSCYASLLMVMFY
jgi:translation initiation factor 6 (eIF-6)